METASSSSFKAVQADLHIIKSWATCPNCPAAQLGSYRYQFSSAAQTNLPAELACSKLQVRGFVKQIDDAAVAGFEMARVLVRENALVSKYQKVRNRFKL